MRMRRHPFGFGMLVIAAMILSTPMLAAVSNDSSQKETFYRELGELFSREDSSAYFDKMELTIGKSTILVDGEAQALDASAEITNSRTMLPIRAIAENAGATVGWEQETSTVVIESAHGDEISCTIGESTITVNDKTTAIDVAPYVKDGRTFLPVRAVADALDMEVEWEQSTSTVVLSAPYQSARLVVNAASLDTGGLGAKTTLNDGSGLWVLQFETPAEAKAAADTLSARGLQVEPDKYIPPINDISTKQTSSQAAGGLSWGVADCGFRTYLSRIGSNLSGSEVVTVVDTGVESTHELLRGKVLNGYDFVSGDNDARDEEGHGTLVSGTIIDCAGNAPVRILPIRVLNSEGSGSTLAVALGVRYAVDNGADVINLSLGGTDQSSSIDSAVSYATSNGVVVVIAAGNSSANTATECPAHITTTGSLVVSAGDKDHNKAGFSNFGASVDLMAPGVRILTSAMNNTYVTASGTSLSAPHVSAAAALIDLAWGKTLSAGEIENKLHAASTYGRWTNQNVGYGFLDLSKAEVPATVTAGIKLSQSSLALSSGGNATITATATPASASVSWSSSNTSVATVSGGKVSAVGGGTAVITASITVSGKEYSATCTVTVTEAQLSLSTNTLSMKVGEEATLSATASVSGMMLSWHSDNTQVATVSNGTVRAVGAGSAKVTVSSNYGGKTYSDVCTVNVSAAGAPVSGEWTTERLSERSGYRIETKTQYRTRGKETTTSTQSSLSGWSLYDQKTEYGPWSAWSDWLPGSVAVIGAEDIREVENRTVTREDGLFYDLYYYKYWNATQNAYYYTYSSNMGGTKYTATGVPASACTPYKSYDGHQAYSYNGNNLWWIETAYEKTSFSTEHKERTRSKVTTYYFYRWGEWSDWRDGTAASDDDMQAETRTLYRYIAL